MPSFPFLLLAWRLGILLPLGVHAPCGAQSWPWPRKGRGSLENQKIPYTGRGYGVTASTQLLPSASILAVAWVSLREEPTYDFPKRIPWTQFLQQGYWQHPQPGSRLGRSLAQASSEHAHLTCSHPTNWSQAWRTPWILPCPPSNQSPGPVNSAS